MDEREQDARDQGRIKLFLHTEEVAVLLTALASLKSELALADEQVGKVKNAEIKMRIPDGLFRSLDPVIDAISNNMMAQSEADFEETGDEEGSGRFHETIHERWEWHAPLIELMQLVLASAYSEGSESQ